MTVSWNLSSDKTEMMKYKITTHKNSYFLYTFTKATGTLLWSKFLEKFHKTIIVTHFCTRHLAREKNVQWIQQTDAVSSVNKSTQTVKCSKTVITVYITLCLTQYNSITLSVWMGCFTCSFNQTKLSINKLHRKR